MHRLLFLLCFVCVRNITDKKMPPAASASSAPLTASLSAAIKVWQGKNPDKRLDQESVVKLLCMTPPIDKIDNSVNAFFNCVQLSLSTNCIDKIPLLPKSGLPKIQILSLGRNMIKKISGLEEIGSTLRELWISYNQISTLDGLNCCIKLETLFISNNKIKEIAEIRKLSANLCLSNCNLTGNPIYSEAFMRTNIIRTLPQLLVLDGELITENERVSSTPESATGRKQTPTTETIHNATPI